MPTASETKQHVASAKNATRRWRRFQIGAIVCLCLLIFDLSRPPAEQWSARALLLAIDTYQATLSPLMPSMGVNCRFTPTCSHYGEGAIRLHGAFFGSLKAAWRILRCGPWTEAGTEDPP